MDSFQEDIEYYKDYFRRLLESDLREYPDETRIDLLRFYIAHNERLPADSIPTHHTRLKALRSLYSEIIQYCPKCEEDRELDKDSINCSKCGEGIFDGPIDYPSVEYGCWKYK